MHVRQLLKRLHERRDKDEFKKLSFQSLDQLYVELV